MARGSYFTGLILYKQCIKDRKSHMYLLIVEASGLRNHDLLYENRDMSINIISLANSVNDSQRRIHPSGHPIPKLHTQVW